TGGTFEYQIQLSLQQPQALVIDFQNSSVIGYFKHRVLDSNNRVVALVEGGQTHPGPGDYFLRHGKKLNLAAGDYRIISQLESPFYLAVPTPYVYTQAHYHQQVHYSQTIVLVGMGIFLALAFYYLVMGLWRRALTDLLYAAFIIGNLLYNGSALLVFRDLFNWHWFYLISTPIIFSNILYIAFVMVLLGITKTRSPRLFYSGLTAMGALMCLWPLAWIAPNWSLEFARYGVGVFAVFGLVAGISQSLARNRVAYFYLIANAAFIVPALFAITLQNLPMGELLLIEHLGMIAVLIEVLLLAQVMSYQIGLAYKERAAHQAAAEQGALLANLAAQVPGVIYQFKMDANGHFSAPYASAGLGEIFGLTPDEVKDDARPALTKVCPEDYPTFMSSIAESAQKMTPWLHEFRVQLPGQGLRWRAGNSQPERQADGSILWHGFITDITERKLIEEKLQHLAQHDPLTDLPNRTLFMDRLNRALEQARRQQEQLALMFIDLDDFKMINDIHGHHVGDALLRNIARHFSSCLRGSDTAARFGGDEFVVLIHPVLTPKDAIVVAEKLQTAFTSPMQMDELSVSITASIGIALYPDHGTTAEGLINTADATMYYTKQQGRNSITLCPTHKNDNSDP
ncbi:MAG TPA: diguanylate cyclase, partial [Cellvibrionaceae bacterium]